MNGLDREATRALQGLAAARTPDEGAAERAWATMQQRLVDGPPPLDIEVGRDESSARARWIVTGIAVAAALVLAVGLASWSAGWIAGADARAPAEAPYSTTSPSPRPDGSTIERAPAIVDAPLTERDTPTTDEPLPPASEPEPAAVAKPTDARPRPTRTGKRRVEPAVVEPKSTEPTRTTTLEAEMRLLARANAAMRAGQHRDALAVLDEHARDYARGQLAPEREYKRAVVLCELGRRDEARAAADAFVRAHPRSPLRAKAEGVCREEDPR